MEIDSQIKNIICKTCKLELALSEFDGKHLNPKKKV
jgi:hypothetical protein